MERDIVLNRRNSQLPVYILVGILIAIGFFIIGRTVTLKYTLNSLEQSNAQLQSQLVALNKEKLVMVARQELLIADILITREESELLRATVKKNASLLLVEEKKIGDVFSRFKTRLTEQEDGVDSFTKCNDFCTERARNRLCL